jgi:phage-related protein
VASKPTVTLTLAGDEKKLTESFSRTETAGQSMVSSVEQGSVKLTGAFDRVGTASKSMGDKVGSSSEGFDRVGHSTEDFVDKADGAESKAIGFTDSLSGVQGIMEGISDQSLSTSERLAMLGQGVADLAGGMANLIIPALGNFGSKLAATAAGQWALNAAQTAWNGITAASAVAMRLLNAAFIASPIGWIVLGIGAVVTAFVLLWNKSAAFRDFFIGIWNAIKAGVGAAIDWIKGVWNGIPAFFSGIVTTIGNIFSGIGGAIKGAFKGALNFVIDMLNAVINFTNKIIYGINLINPFGDIPDIPKIPRLHSGGIVPGLPGEERLMMLQAGEKVSTSSQGGSGGTWLITGSGALFELIANGIRTGDIQLVDGSGQTVRVA